MTAPPTQPQQAGGAGANSTATGLPGPVRAGRHETVAAVLVGLVLAYLVSHSLTAAFVLSLVAGAVLLTTARPASWILLALCASWFLRIPAESGLAPRFIEFLDFPLVLAAFGSALRQRREVDVDPANRRILELIAAVALVMAASWVVHDPGQPARLVASWLVLLEPFLLIAAMLLGNVTERERRRLLRTLLVIAALQIPACLVAIATIFRVTRDQDTIRGTLLNADQGAPLTASALLIGFLVLLCLARRKTAMAFGTVSLALMLVNDAKQILLVIPVALIVMALVQLRPGPDRARALLATVVLAGVTGVAIANYAGSSAAFDFIQRTGAGGGKSAVAAALWKDLRSSTTSLLLGEGPGNSVSRLAFLSTPTQLREGSPVQVLGLTPAAGPPRYLAVAAAGPFVGVSSFSSPQSSAFGVVGDLGLIGGVAFLAMVGAVIRSLRRRASPLRPAALAAWAVVVPLAFAFDWLEEPPFTLLLGLLTGLALLAPTVVRGGRNLQEVHTP